MQFLVLIAPSAIQCDSKGTSWYKKRTTSATTASASEVFVLYIVFYIWMVKLLYKYLVYNNALHHIGHAIY